MIYIPCFVRSLFRPYHKAKSVLQKLFCRLSVLLIHSEQKERCHERHHQQKRRCVAYNGFSQKIGRYSDSSAERKANELPLGKIKDNLCLYLRQILRYRYIRQIITSIPYLCVPHPRTMLSVVLPICAEHLSDDHVKS